MTLWMKWHLCDKKIKKTLQNKQDSHLLEMRQHAKTRKKCMHVCYVTEATRFVVLKRNRIKYMELFWNTISLRADKLGYNALIKFLICSMENLKSSADAQGASPVFLETTAWKDYDSKSNSAEIRDQIWLLINLYSYGYVRGTVFHQHCHCKS